MKHILSHMNTTTSWSAERRNTLSIGYCFNVDIQGKPSNIPGRDTDVG